MATSLAAQLAARQTLDSSRLQTAKTLKNPPSFIYTPRHAASISVVDLASLADNAWEQLAAIDGFFQDPANHKAVLGEQARGLDRGALTKEENEKVGKTVDRVLRALGKHMLLKPAGIVLEWLVRRFRVQDLNVSSLVALFLPYHTTPHFASGLNLIPLATLETSPFAALVGAKKSLSPVSLTDLIDLLPPFSRMTTARPLLDFILHLPLSYLHNEQVPHRALTAFWLQVLAGYLDRAKDKLPEGEKAAVLSTVLDVLRSARSAPDTLLASYILVARFAMHNPFDAETLRVVLKGVVGNRARSHVADEETDAALVTTLVVISQLGEEEVALAPGKKFLGNSGWKSLLKTSKLDELVVTLSNQYDATRFMRPFLQTLAEEARTSEECLHLLTAVLVPRPAPGSSTPLTLPAALISHLLASLFLSISASEVDSAASPTALLKPLSQIYQRYPSIWTEESSAVAFSLSEANEKEALQRVLQAMNAVLLGGASPTSSNAASDALVLSSSAPDVALRVSALKEVLASSSTLQDAGNAVFLKDTLLARLAEPEAQIAAVLFAAESSKTLSESLSADETLAAILSALNAASLSSKDTSAYLALALPFLSSTFLASHPSATSSVLQSVFWPRLHATTFGGKVSAASTLAVYAAIKGSELEKSHLWFAGLGAVLPASAEGISKETNEKIVEQVAKNFASLATKEIEEVEAFLLAGVAEGDVLSHLVALRFAGKVVSSRRVSFVQRIIVALRAQSTGLDALVGDTVEQLLDEQNSSVVAQGVQDAVLAQPKKDETLRKVKAAVLVGAVKAVVPVQEAAWSWLSASTGEDVEEQYRTLCTSVYRLAHARSDAAAAEALGSELLSTLFSSLVTDDVVAFLASVFISTITAIDLRLAALKYAAVFVDVLSAAISQPKGKLVDWQIVVPSVVVALADEDKRIRVEALRLVEQIKSTLSSPSSTPSKKAAAATVYGRDKFYGKEQSKLVKYLDVADVVAYLGKVLASATELTLSASHLAVLHSSLLDDASSASSRKSALTFKISTYLTSHVLAFSSSSVSGLASRIKILTALEGVKDKDKSAALVALLVEAVARPTSAAVTPEQATEYARLVLQPFDGAARKWLEGEETRAIEALVNAVETVEITGLKAAVRKEALRVIAKSVFGAVKGETRMELWKRLVKLAVSSEARVNTDVLACLRSCKVDTETLATFLTSLRTSFSSPVPSGSIGKGAKRGRASLSGASSTATGPASLSARTERLPELVVVLESVEFASIQASHGLLLGLFDLLATLVDLPSGAGTTDVSYPGQLLLGALARVVENVKPESGVTADSIRMAPVLDFMRSAINPQTYHQSLLLLAQLGPLVPDQLVHNVIPIFTFMGANVLQRDDAYSLRVVDQTLDNIVPALVKAMQKSASGREGLLAELKDLLRAFTDAAAHVPRHRRINLFVRLVETLGPKEFLSAVAMLLVDKAGKVDESALPLVLFEHFDVDVQLSALKQSVEEVARLVNLEVSFLQVAPETAAPSKAREQSVQLLTFLAYALESKQLLGKVDSARTSGSETVDTDLSELVRGLLDLSSATSPSFSASDVHALSAAADYAVHASVALMSTKSFADALLWLLELADPAIQPRAFALLRARLPHVKPTRRGDLSPAIVAVVEQALVVLGEQNAESSAIDGALSTLAVVADSVFLAEDAALAKTVLPLVEVAKDASRSNASRVTALEVIRKLTTRLGPRLIPLVAKLVPFALELLKEEAKAGVDATVDLVTGAYSTLEGLFSSVPTFIGAQLDKVFSASLSPDVMSLSEVKGSAPAKARAALLSTAAKKLPAKTIYPAIVRLHASLDGTQRGPLLGLLDVLNRTLRHGAAADIVENYRPIFKLFLTVFDLRRIHSDSLDHEDVTDVEDNALGAFVQFILKLNEQIFRPLFLRTYDWAVIDLAEESDAKAGLTARRTVLFKVVDRLIGQLKSIFVPYYSFMLDQTVELLEAFASGQETDKDLWNAVVSALTKALDADETGFWTASRLSKLSLPLSRQIEVPADIATPATYHTLLSTFSDLLSSHETHLKTLNSAFLHLTRSDDLRVKRGAIEALRQMWEAVGDGMLGLVPETVPFLAEAREETGNGVEAATRALIKDIEECLGEGLDEHLEN